MEPGLHHIDSAGSSSQPAGVPLVRDTHDEQVLDEALWETFPASDPIAVSSADRGRKEKQLQQPGKADSSA